MIAAIVLDCADSALPCSLAEIFPHEEVLGLWLCPPGDDWPGDAARVFRSGVDVPSAPEIVQNVLLQLAGKDLHGIYLRDRNLARETAAGLAVRLEGTCLVGCLAVRRDAGGTLHAALKPFAGRAYAEVEVLRTPFVATLKDPEVPLSAPARTGATPQDAAWQPAAGLPWTTIEERASQASGIDMARYIASGGLGMGSLASFDKLRRLADVLGAHVGATLAAVEAGWATSDTQIGQTGNTVHPDIYLALGISGAPQHVSDVYAKHMLAVNKDPGAPIFGMADVGVVGDATAFVEALTVRIEEAGLKLL